MRERRSFSSWDPPTRGKVGTGRVRWVVALVGVALLGVATAEAQIVADRSLIRCGTSHDLPEGPPRATEYQVAEAPAGSTTEIGILFLYTDHFTASKVRTRTRDWIRTANSLFDAGTSGIRLASAGVRAAPRSVSREALSESQVKDPGGFAPVLKEVTGLDSTLRGVRRELGADLVTVVAPSPRGGGTAWVWFKGRTANEMRERSYNVVGMAHDPAPAVLFYEGYALAHEVGHNLGLVHDRQAIDDVSGAPSSDEVESWLWDSAGFGYVHPDSGLVHLRGPREGSPASAGTVMAYAVARLKGFSRPRGDLPVAGREHIELDAGDSTTNADRALRKTAAAVAAFYELETNEPPPDDDETPTGGRCVDRDGNTLNCHTTAAGHVFAVQYFHQGEWRWAEIAVRSGDSAVFHFFGPSNLEVFAKVLNGCAIDGTVWVYASGLTDLPIYLSVLRAGGEETEGFPVPDGMVLRPNNGGRLNWCN